MTDHELLALARADRAYHGAPMTVCTALLKESQAVLWDMGSAVFMALGFGRRRGRDGERERGEAERERRGYTPFDIHAAIH